MSYKYIHNSQDKQVFRMPLTPSVDRKTDNKGRHTGWYVRMEMDVTRADNVLNGSQWTYPIKERRDQYFDGQRYTEQQVIDSFLARSKPDGVEVEKEEYIEIKESYENEAKSNHA